MDRNRSVAVWTLLLEFEFLNGLFAAYMLTAASLAPLYGRLSDLVGRKPLLLGCIAIFLVGSALCGGKLGGIHFDLDSSMAEYIFFLDSRSELHHACNLPRRPRCRGRWNPPA